MSRRGMGRGMGLPGAASTLVAVALAVAACSPSSDVAGGTLVVTGSSTIAPLVVEIAQRYEREHAGVRIDVQSRSTVPGARKSGSR